MPAEEYFWVSPELRGMVIIPLNSQILLLLWSKRSQEDTEVNRILRYLIMGKTVRSTAFKNGSKHGFGPRTFALWPVSGHVERADTLMNIHEADFAALAVARPVVNN